MPNLKDLRKRIGSVRSTQQITKAMIKVLYPLEHTHHLFFSAYDEPFADLNNVTNGPRAGFDQNRAYVGFRYQVTHAVGVELAYMNQFQNKTTEDISSNNAVVSLDFSL